MIFGYLILFISVMISAIAAYYSVAGLTAIFSAAVIPVIIMGGALEAGKIVATVWLHNNWRRAGYAFKMYLIPAIVFLMLLTSMGIFGFLSKAHSDQSLVTGDAGSKVAIYDEKIKISKDNIDANRKALKQMDEAVDQVMGRSTDEKGADKAVSIRRGQQKERARLLAEISAEQKTISTLSEQRAPFAADLRKVEAEVGPIKYIAAFIYGDEASNNMLEAAVRWVIILIVIVFDPLALTLILAANRQIEWAKEKRAEEEREFNEKYVELKTEEPKEFSLFQWSKPPEDKEEEEEDDETPPEALIKLFQDGLKKESPVEDHGTCPKCETSLMHAPGIAVFCPNKECDVFDDPVRAKEELEAKELQEFFWRGRMIARALDAEAAERTAQEANDKLAEIEPEEPNIDLVVEQANEFVELEKERDALQEALGILATELDHVKSHLPDVEQYRNQLLVELEQAGKREVQLNSWLDDLKHDLARSQERQTELETALAVVPDQLHDAAEARERLESTVTELTEDNAQKQEWIEQLEQDLREAIQLAHDKTQELAALRELESEAPRTQIIADDELGEVVDAGFGTEFPKNQKKGDMFLRVDYLPSRLFKWNGTKWIEIDKSQTDRYAYDTAYIKLLVEKLQRGEYDLDDLNDTERAQVAIYLKDPKDA